MKNEIRYSKGGGTESLVFKNENPKSNWFGTTFYVEQMPNGIWSIYSENPKWEKRLEYEYGFASKEDAIDIAKINAGVMNEDDPESYYMSREFAIGGNLDDKTLKGYRVRIFRSDISTSSANILNSENSAILVTDGMSGDSSTVLSSEPHLKLIKRDIFGKTVLSAEPVNYGHEGKSKMFGGSFIWSTDSRFRNYVSENPIALHDRVEYKKGGNIDSETQSKIDKLEKVVNSTMIPDSIKEKAKLEIENLKATASKSATSGIAEEKGLSAEQRELNKKVLALVKKNNIESAYDFQSLVGQTLEDSNYHEVFFRFAKLVDPTIKTKENWYRSTEFDGTEVTRDVAIKISQLCSWDLNMIAPAFEFVLKMSGRQNIADKLEKAILNKEVETPANNELVKPAKKIKKGTLSEIAIYVPKRSIEALTVTIEGKSYSFSNDDIIDGIYVLKTSVKKTPKVTRTQFEEEEFEFGKGGNVGDVGNITDSKSMYEGKRGIIEMDMGNEWIVKILANGKEKSVTVRKSGFKVMDDEFGKGGYTAPAYDLPIYGKYKFVIKDGKEYILSIFRYERENDTEDSLVISQDQDSLREELGSIIIKNSAWRNLTKSGKTVMARASKGPTGKITKLQDTFAKGGELKVGNRVSYTDGFNTYEGVITHDYTDEKFYVGDKYGYQVSGFGDRLRPEQLTKISDGVDKTKKSHSWKHKSLKN
jgi:hypothetical protein